LHIGSYAVAHRWQHPLAFQSRDVSVIKSGKFFWNCCVNPLLTFHCNTVQGKYVCPPYKIRLIAKHSYIFLQAKLFKFSHSLNCALLYTPMTKTTNVHAFLIFSIKLSTCFEQTTFHHQQVCLYVVHLENIYDYCNGTPLDRCYCDINHIPQVHYCIHKILLLVPIVSQINLNAPHPTSWRSILISSLHLCLGITTEIVYAPLIYPICAACFTHLILLDLISQIFGGYRS